MGYPYIPTAYIGKELSMNTEIMMEVIMRPEEFIAEIVKNHGKESMQYVWALSTVADAKRQVRELKAKKAMV